MIKQLTYGACILLLAACGAETPAETPAATSSAPQSAPEAERTQAIFDRSADTAGNIVDWVDAAYDADKLVTFKDPVDQAAADFVQLALQMLSLIHI